MNPLAKFSVNNTLLVNMLFVFVIIAGLLAMNDMTREAYPHFSFDMVVVQTTYPGATPSEVEKLITIPIERELKQIDDVKEISSVSAEGYSRIALKLEEDTPNKDRVINEIQRAVDRVDDLPDDLPDRPVVDDLKTQDRPIIEVSLSGKLEEQELRDHALALEKKILDITDVASVDRKGYRDREIWVEVEPETLKQKQLSLQSVGQALQQKNQVIPGGKIYLNHVEFNLRTTGEFETAEDVAKTVVRASSLGSWLHVDDVAKVSDTFAEETVLYKTQGTRTINLIVIKKSDGDTIEIVTALNDIINTYKKTATSNLKIRTINDTSYFINRRQDVLVNNGILGLILVVLSLFTFLSARTAIGACIGIPTALLLTFIFMHSYGISFNLISMFGLIMVLGMLVDEDIVISENIFRYLEQGYSPKEATLRGVTEVAKPLVITVLTTVAAFLPLLYMSGVMGKFIANIPVVVILVLLASLVEALVILPSHICELNSGVFEKKVSKKKSHHLFDQIVARYKAILHHMLKYRYRYSLLLIAIFIQSVWMAASNPSRFRLFPDTGVERFRIDIETKVGDSLQTTSQKAEQLEKLVASLPASELEDFTTEIGMTGGGHGAQTKLASNVGMMEVYLTPEEDRERSAQSIIDDLREQSKDFKGFKQINFHNEFIFI